MVAFGYILYAGFDESRYFSRYSFDYYLLVDSKVKDFPLPKEFVEVTYHSSCGDGPKLPSSAVHVKVGNIDDSYLSKIERFITENGLVRTSTEGVFASSTVYEDKNGDEIEILVYHNKGGIYSIIMEWRDLSFNRKLLY
ncbi:MAG: hypothetical protein HQK72_13120 [Desulfamplus sp.]|nr:hypothetical protein [Desulfamplus sp.]